MMEIKSIFLIIAAMGFSLFGGCVGTPRIATPEREYVGTIVKIDEKEGYVGAYLLVQDANAPDFSLISSYSLDKFVGKKISVRAQETPSAEMDYTQHEYELWLKKSGLKKHAYPLRGMSLQSEPKILNANP
jgi:hypothetical protein